MPRQPNHDRDALIDRARDLFWRQGWAGTSMKDLERTLDMRPGSFYAAFGSKEALYALALDRYAEDGAARLATLAEEKGPFAALRAYPALVVACDTAPASACMLAKTVLETGAASHALGEKASDYLARMESRFRDLFAAAQDAGDVDPTLDPARLARRYQSDLLGLRVSAERRDVDAAALAEDIALGLDLLRPR
ncbi:helix-turn-helix domain-containing protein [Roseobacter sp. HKCCA0434]|uniref:TetR/AcrR family transcriptional regulator n=1 Tax=Roseobacter sp. HKCCA0434 TaxID=3079297 RepID=UPI002905D26C|nr:helix-turn-helix domain-containing protein [Roseobacter sp. HKCCA0434]